MVTGTPSCQRAFSCSRRYSDFLSVESAIPSSSNPYRLDGSSADSTSNRSMVLSTPLALVTPVPQAPEKLRMATLVESVRVPPLGAAGLA